jgi:type VI secretion system secreted protein VgrG
VQYDETDWDFLQRRLEHEGKYYYFEHAGPRDRLVVGDANSGATRIGKLALLPSPPPESRAEIVEWTFDETRVTARVAVLDYDPMTPDRRIAAKAAVGDPRTRSISTFGTVVRFGEQLVDHDAASRIAGLRAQRTACEAKVYAGRTTSRRLRAGVVFELAGHREDDGEYLATEIEHRGGVLPDSADDVDEEYRGSFRAIPIDRQFRPELRTRWPRIHGFTIGHIATDGAGATAMLDEHGRYKVKLVFDVATTRGAASSMWIRMAQPYAGASEGSHHPLRKGTEVLIAHLDGDPDRPVIVGAVPNPFTVSPTTAQNPTQSVVQTASGIRIEIEDHQETR